MFEIESSHPDFEGYYNYNSLNGIEVLEGSKLMYDNFFENYMLPNIPCVIKGVTSKWKSSQLWVKDDAPNFQYLSEKYGNNNVTVHKCSERYYNCQKSYKTTLTDYLEYFQECTSQDSNPSKLEYLKNWHLKLKYQEDDFYEVPIFFASDWLNEYYTHCSDDDYRFVYMGPKGTWTPFHADVFMSYSWSANVCGRKRWLIFPPGEEIYLRDVFGNLPYDIENENHSQKFFEVIQEKGDAIFVPSGWHHQVWNIEDTISINHNWINGCNIKMMYDSLITNFIAVQKEIEDCREMEDFEEHCQLMLNSSFGMDFHKFYEFLKFIASSRIDMKKGTSPKTSFIGHKIGPNHILFDLKSVKTVLELFINLEEVNSLKYFIDTDVKPLELLHQITVVLDT
ncbi:jumonji domain containing 4 [Leptinotarsa decemlineata]|uniref:jumonji domain containing 4 n=1 Tax=Leptinotarsa decemlineata TaxID=7539 RepID=UPI003D309C3C